MNKLKIMRLLHYVRKDSSIRALVKKQVIASEERARQSHKPNPKSLGRIVPLRRCIELVEIGP
mgnify:CR=1 FL=1